MKKIIDWNIFNILSKRLKRQGGVQVAYGEVQNAGLVPHDAGMCTGAQLRRIEVVRRHQLMTVDVHERVDHQLATNRHRSSVYAADLELLVHAGPEFGFKIHQRLTWRREIEGFWR